MKRRKRGLIVVLILAAIAGLVTLWWTTSQPVEPPPEANEQPNEPDTPTEPEDREPAISGRIVDRKDGTGVAAATVTLTCGETGRSVTAAGNGQWSFETATPGECTVECASVSHVAAGPDQTARVDVTLREDQPLSGVDLYLYPAASIRGQVVNATGQPIADAMISLLMLEAPGMDSEFVLSPDVKTGADGRFSINGLGPGRVAVLAEHDTLGSAEAPDEFLRGGDTLQITVRLVPSGAIAGRVEDEGGRPVSAALTITAAGWARPRRLTSDEAGRFDANDVPAGPVTVRATAFGLNERSVEVTVPIDGVVQAQIRLRNREGIGGRVEQPDGEPARQAIVTLDGQTVATTDIEGNFWIDQRPDAQTQLAARHPDFGPSQPVAVAGPTRNVVLTLQSGGFLTGRAVSSDGEPIGVYTVWVLGFRGSATVRDPSGRFKTQSLEPGMYSLSLDVPGRPAMQTLKWQVRSGKITDIGDVVVGVGGAVVGRLVDAKTGEPVASAPIRIEQDRGPPSSSGPDGRFRITGLSEQSRSLWIRKDGYVTRAVTGVAPPEGREVDVGDISLTPSTGPGRRIQYSGVGVSVRIESERLILDNIFEGGPAARAGLTSGTAIVSINGYSMTELTPRQAIEMIRGEEGTEVALEVQRPGGQLVETVRIERANVDAGH